MKKEFRKILREQKRNQRKPQSIIDFAVELHRKNGDISRYLAAIVRRFYLKSVKMYGFDHPVTTRYKAEFDRRQKIANDADGEVINKFFAQ